MATQLKLVVLESEQDANIGRSYDPGTLVITRVSQYWNNRNLTNFQAVWIGDDGEIDDYPLPGYEPTHLVRQAVDWLERRNSA